MKVVQLYDSNARDVPATLRKIAAGIEDDPVSSCVVVTFGRDLKVYGLGDKGDSGTAMLLLQAAIQRLAGAVEREGL